MAQSIYQKPMPPWPALEPYARQVHLARNGLSVHIYATSAGTALPAVLIHGLGDEADTWRHVFPLVAPHRQVIALDLPGFGRSDKPGRAYTLPFFQDVIVELLDVLQIPEAILVGHSFGAAIAQAITLDIPLRAGRLVLIGGSLVNRVQKINPAILIFMLPVLGEWLYNRLRGDPQAAYRTLEPYYAAIDRLPEADRKFLFERVNQRVWDDGQRQAFLSTLRSFARWLPRQQSGLPDRLASLATPTTILWGEADRINPVENGRALVSIQPSAHLVLVPGAGHNLHQEQPDVVLDAIEG